MTVAITLFVKNKTLKIGSNEYPIKIEGYYDNKISFGLRAADLGDLGDLFYAFGDMRQINVDFGIGKQKALIMEFGPCFEANAIDIYYNITIVALKDAKKKKSRK